MDWLDAYLRIPHREGGRSRQAADCFGLCRLIWLDRASLDLPLHDTVIDDDSIARTITGEAEHWLPVRRGAERIFDAVVLRSRIEHDGRMVWADVHLGLVTRPGWLIHSEARTGPVHLRLDHPAIRHRVRRILRHRDLA